MPLIRLDYNKCTFRFVSELHIAAFWRFTTTRKGGVFFHFRASPENEKTPFNPLLAAFRLRLTGVAHKTKRLLFLLTPFQYTPILKTHPVRKKLKSYSSKPLSQFKEVKHPHAITARATYIFYCESKYIEIECRLSRSIVCI